MDPGDLAEPGIPRDQVVANDTPAGGLSVLPRKYTFNRRNRAKVGYTQEYRTNYALRKQHTTNDPALDKKLPEL